MVPRCTGGIQRHDQNASLKYNGRGQTGIIVEVLKTNTESQRHMNEANMRSTYCNLQSFALNRTLCKMQKYSFTERVVETEHEPSQHHELCATNSLPFWSCTAGIQSAAAMLHVLVRFSDTSKRESSQRNFPQCTWRDSDGVQGHVQNLSPGFGDDVPHKTSRPTGPVWPITEMELTYNGDHAYQTMWTPHVHPSEGCHFETNVGIRELNASEFTTEIALTRRCGHAGESSRHSARSTI